MGRPIRADFPAAHGVLLDEGRQAGDHPGTFAAARARIAGTLTMLDNVGVHALDNESDAHRFACLRPKTMPAA